MNIALPVEWISRELDSKLLLRSDGTAVYMTQDLGTAILRYNDFNFDEMIYVVGNEQNHHFCWIVHLFIVFTFFTYYALSIFYH